MKLLNMYSLILYHFLEGKSWEETPGECASRTPGNDFHTQSYHPDLDKAKAACITTANCIGVYKHCYEMADHENLNRDQQYRTCGTSITPSSCGSRFYKIPSNKHFQIQNTDGANQRF